jgi:hypothetical protein
VENLFDVGNRFAVFVFKFFKDVGGIKAIPEQFKCNSNMHIPGHFSNDGKIIFAPSSKKNLFSFF